MWIDALLCEEVEGSRRLLSQTSDGAMRESDRREKKHMTCEKNGKIKIQAFAIEKCAM